MIHYNLINNYKDKKPFDFSMRKTISLILRTIYKEEGLKGDYVISFILVDKETIHNINRDYRKIDRPTDVISFAQIDGNENRSLSYELGDIYLCVEKVFEQALEYGHSPNREFAFLITHGTLHLLGYDHMVKEDEEVMFGIQDKVLEIAKINR